MHIGGVNSPLFKEKVKEAYTATLGVVTTKTRNCKTSEKENARFTVPTGGIQLNEAGIISPRIEIIIADLSEI